MSTFREEVANYRDWKFKNRGSRDITSAELSKLREEFKRQSRSNVSLREGTNDKVLREEISNYRQWKLREHGTSKVTPTEIRAIREKISGRDVSDKEPKSLREAVTGYKAWKLKEHGTAAITRAEFQAIKESMNNEQKLNESDENDEKFSSIKEAVKAYRQWKLAEHKSTELTKDELVAIREAYLQDLPEVERLKEYIKITQKKVSKQLAKLTEGDMAGMQPPADPSAAPLPGGDMGGDANQVVDAAGAAPGAPTNIDPTLVASIQGVKDAVDQLATQAGIETSDLGADPNAALPPVDGQMDPNAAPAPAPAPMTESTRKNSDLQSIRDRIAKRELALRENGAQEIGRSVVSSIGVKKFTDPSALNEDHQSGSDNNPESRLTIPTEKQVAAGYPKGGEISPAATWPTKAAPGLKNGLNETSESRADQYLQKKLYEEKLDFTSIKDAMKNGRLG